MTSIPVHHAGDFCNVEAGLLELAAEIVEIKDFEIQAHAFAQNGIVWAGLTQHENAIAARSAHTPACLHSKSLRCV